MRVLYVTLALIICGEYLALAQTAIKFGKVGYPQLKSDTPEWLGDADAYIIQDIGVTRFKYDQNVGFRLIHDRHTIVKIISKNGYKWADQSIPLYADNNMQDRISGLKGFTYILENNVVSKVKLDNSAVFMQETNEHWNSQKFTMPDVREGSVIEFTYSVVSDRYFRLTPWQFQYEIPTMYSSFTVEIPEYFNYSIMTQGYFPIASDEPEHNQRREVFNIMNGTGKRAQEVLSYQTKKHHFFATNVNALTDENFAMPASNYLTRIEFELRSTQFPGSVFKEYRTTWGALNKQFLDSDYFGKLLQQSNFLKDPINQINARYQGSRDKISAAYRLITSKVKWNNFYSKYAGTTLKKAYDDGTGNIADINLLMTTFLRGLGYKADPVLVSTRNHGLVRENYPVSQQFNYVICAVDTENGTMLIDAADHSAPLGFLPEKCLNGRGWRVTDEGGAWVNLVPKRGWRQGNELLMSLNSDLTVRGTYKSSRENYASFDRRRSIQQEGEDGFLSNAKAEMTNWSVVNSTLRNSQDMSVPLIEEYEVERKLEEINGLIFFSPIMNDEFIENPFKSDERTYPVDFSFPRFNYYSLTMKIDEGFIVDEIPEPLSIGVPGGKAVFTYNVIVSDNEIKVTSILNIRKHLFLPEEYQGLREFFSLLVAKQNEQLVLKRKT